MRTDQDYEATIGMVRALKACATLSRAMHITTCQDYWPSRTLSMLKVGAHTLQGAAYEAIHTSWRMTRRNTLAKC